MATDTAATSHIQMLPAEFPEIIAEQVMVDDMDRLNHFKPRLQDIHNIRNFRASCQQARDVATSFWAKVRFKKVEISATMAMFADSHTGIGQWVEEVPLHFHDSHEDTYFPRANI